MSDEMENFRETQILGGGRDENQHESESVPFPANDQDMTEGAIDGGDANSLDLDDQPEQSARLSPVMAYGERAETQHEQDEEDEGRADDSAPSDSADVERSNDDNGDVESLWPQQFDWADLERRFGQKMEEKNSEEQEILQEFDRLTEFYNLWVQTGNHKELDRASKRLRTRITYVQNSEEQLEERRSHHANVVQAFQSALQLLKGL